MEKPECFRDECIKLQKRKKPICRVIGKFNCEYVMKGGENMKQKNVSLVLKIPRDVKEKLRKKANDMGLKPTQLLKMKIMEIISEGGKNG
jgi:hypothetical protein